MFPHSNPLLHHRTVSHPGTAKCTSEYSPTLTRPKPLQRLAATSSWCTAAVTAATAACAVHCQQQKQHQMVLSGLHNVPCPHHHLGQQWQQQRRAAVIAAAGSKGSKGVGSSGKSSSGGGKGFGGNSGSSSKANNLARRKCPCGSGQLYQACCGRYHSGSALAPTPEALLRARFSAYALQDVDYLVKTTHKENPEHTGDPLTYARSLQRVARAVEYIQLNIVEPGRPSQPPADAGSPSSPAARGSTGEQLPGAVAAESAGGSSGQDKEAFLKFSVRWRSRSGGPEELTGELSHFKRVNGAWLYYAAVE